MSDLTYNTIYGIDIHEYAKTHGTTVDALIKKVKLDISIIHKNYRTYADRNTTLTADEIQVAVKIRKAKEKKERHLKHLQQYVNNG